MASTQITAEPTNMVAAPAQPMDRLAKHAARMIIRVRHTLAVSPRRWYKNVRLSVMPSPPDESALVGPSVRMNGGRGGAPAIELVGGGAGWLPWGREPGGAATVGEGPSVVRGVIGGSGGGLIGNTAKEIGAGGHGDGGLITGGDSGGGDGESGGGGGGDGGDGGGIIIRTPQSEQSEPGGQRLYEAPMPPSSHTSSRTKR